MKRLERKLDRFEQLYRNELARRARGPSDKQWPSITLTLLRRQHASYVRMVKDSAATFKDALKKLERYKKVLQESQAMTTVSKQSTCPRCDGCL